MPLPREVAAATNAVDAQTRIRAIPNPHEAAHAPTAKPFVRFSPASSMMSKDYEAALALEDE